MGLQLTVRLLFAILLLATACRKQDDNANSNCISEVTLTPAAMASQTDSMQTAAIDTLFARNSLSTTGLQFFSIDSNTYVPPGRNSAVSQEVVLAYLWFNDLPVFMYNDNFVFYDGVLQPVSIRFAGPPPPPNPAFRLTLASLRLTYNDNFGKVSISGGSAAYANTIRHPPAGYKDSCLTAQRGYVDASYFSSAVPYGTRLTKAWKLTPVGQLYPMVVVEDSTGNAWPVPVNIP